MKKQTGKIFWLILFFCLGTFSLLRAQFDPPKNKKLKIIFDSDMGPDYDDAGAIAMLHAYADSGNIDILATIACTKYAHVSNVFKVFNTYFKRPNIPIGVPKGEAYEGRDSQKWTDSLVAKYPHEKKSNDDRYDAVTLYRKVLASQPDASVTLVTVGFFTNLENLLKSGPDQYSKLTGAELVKRKIRLMVSMAGKFPEGKEYNMYKQAKSANEVLRDWTTPILFTGWEIGEEIITGLGLVNNTNIINSPVKDAYRISMPKRELDKNGRRSWDQTAVLIAVKGYRNYFNIKRGKIIMFPDGSNKWEDNDNGQHAYLTLKISPRQIENDIEKVMMHQP